jgi:hypothetical protein
VTKHIQAYFHERDNAEGAASELRALGATEIETGRAIDDYEAQFNPISSNLSLVPQSEGHQVARLPSLTQETLLASEGAVSRTSDADATGEGTPVLSFKVEEGLYDAAKGIVEKNGGVVD